MQDHPVVMPRGELAGAVEYLTWRRLTAVLRNEVHGMIMEEEEGNLEAGDHPVLIVARVGKDGGTVCGARQVFKAAAALDPKLSGVSQLHALIQIRVGTRPSAIDGVKVEG